MTDHTPEPWSWEPAEYEEEHDGQLIFYQSANLRGPNNAAVFRLDMDEWQGLDDETAARIVACVNACAGVPTEELGDVKALVEAADAMDRLLDCTVDQDWRDMNLPVPERKKRKAALAPFRKD